MNPTNEHVILSTPEGKDRFKLNKSMQFLYSLYRSGTANNLSIGLRMTGKIDPARLQTSAQKLYQDNDCFRMLMIDDQDGPYFQFVESIEPCIEMIVPTGTTPEERLEAAKKQAADTAWFTKMDPLKSALRVMIFELEPEEDYFVFLCMHHLFTDGTTVILTARQFLMAYLGAPTDEGPEQGTMMSYLAEDEAYASSPEAAADLAYWTERGAGVKEIPFLPNLSGNELFDVVCLVPADAVAKVQKSLRVSTGVLFISAFHAALARHGELDDTAFDYCSVNRFDKRYMNTAGVVFRSLLCRAHLDPTISVADFIKDQRARNAEDMKHQGVIPGPNRKQHLVVQELGGGMGAQLPFKLDFWTPGYSVAFMKQVPHPYIAVIMVFPGQEGYLLKAVHSPTYYRCGDLQRIFNNMRDFIIAAAETPDRSLGDLLESLEPTDVAGSSDGRRTEP